MGGAGALRRRGARFRGGPGEEFVVERVLKGRRVTGEARQRLAADLKERYAEGGSIRMLARETGRSYGFVHKMLNEAGTNLRGRGGTARGALLSGCRPSA